MKRRFLSAAGLFLAVAALSACGESASGPTSEIADCLEASGAEITTDATDLEFAVDYGYGVKDKHGLDKSRTLSVGSYESAINGGWKVYYVVRKGFQISLSQLTQNPEKAAKVVAYAHPVDASASKSADACLGLKGTT
jgi:hypothetical protein